MQKAFDASLEKEGLGQNREDPKQLAPGAQPEPQMHSARNMADKQPAQTLQPYGKQITNVAQFKNSKLFQKFMQKEASKATITPLNAAAQPPQE